MHICIGGSKTKSIVPFNRSLLLLLHPSLPENKDPKGGQLAKIDSLIVFLSVTTYVVFPSIFIYFQVVFLSIFKLYFYQFPSCISIYLQVVFPSISIYFHLFQVVFPSISKLYFSDFGLSVSPLIDIPIPPVNGSPRGGPSASSQTDIPFQKFSDVSE